MIPARMVSGEPFEVTFSFKSSFDTPFDLTGFTAKSELRNQREKGAVLLTILNNSPYLSRPQTGQIKLRLPASVTSQFTFNTAVLDMVVTNGTDGIRSDLIAIELEQGVTKL